MGKNDLKGFYMAWMQYSQIKMLVDEYWKLKDEKKYDEFILKLTDILDI